MSLLRDDVGTDHQGTCKNNAWKVTCEEERTDGDTTCRGRVNNHIVGWRNQHTLNRGCDGNSRRKVNIITTVYHHRDLKRAEGCGICRSGSGDTTEEVGCQNVYHGETTGHPADEGVCQIQQLLRDTTGSHVYTHGDEERNGHQ